MRDAYVDLTDLQAKYPKPSRQLTEHMVIDWLVSKNSTDRRVLEQCFPYLVHWYATHGALDQIGRLIEHEDEHGHHDEVYSAVFLRCIYELMDHGSARVKDLAFRPGKEYLERGRLAVSKMVLLELPILSI